jgi:hypothetical protein
MSCSQWLFVQKFQIFLYQNSKELATWNNAFLSYFSPSRHTNQYTPADYRKRIRWQTLQEKQIYRMLF